MKKMIRSSTISVYHDSVPDDFYQNPSRDTIASYRKLAEQIKALKLPYVRVEPRQSYVRIRYAQKIKRRDYDMLLESYPEVAPINHCMTIDVSTLLENISNDVANNICNSIEGVHVEVLIHDYNNTIRWLGDVDTLHPIDDLSFLMHVTFE